MNNLIGQKFERLLVIQSAKKDKWGKSQWLCQCDCGREKIILDFNLKSGNTKSCGCLQIEKMIQRFTKHGHSKRNKWSKTYKSWLDMNRRCNNPNDKDYCNYRGRGITICKRWKKFINFLEDMGEQPRGLQIDRINNDGNYCKSNCRWATRKEQGRNRRNNHLITFNSKTQCLVAWAEEFQIHRGTLFARINQGWSIEKALRTQVKKYQMKRKENEK